jgi:hypothetical protein
MGGKKKRKTPYPKCPTGKKLKRHGIQRRVWLGPGILLLRGAMRFDEVPTCPH